jgi:hypothetical protein
MTGSTPQNQRKAESLRHLLLRPHSCERLRHLLLLLRPRQASAKNRVVDITANTAAVANKREEPDRSEFSPNYHQMERKLKRQEEDDKFKKVKVAGAPKAGASALALPSVAMAVQMKNPSS